MLSGIWMKPLVLKEAAASISSAGIPFLLKVNKYMKKVFWIIYAAFFKQLLHTLLFKSVCEVFFWVCLPHLSVGFIFAWFFMSTRSKHSCMSSTYHWVFIGLEMDWTILHEDSSQLMLFFADCDNSFSQKTSSSQVHNAMWLEYLL